MREKYGRIAMAAILFDFSAAGARFRFTRARPNSWRFNEPDSDTRGLFTIRRITLVLLLSARDRFPQSRRLSTIGATRKR